MASMRRFLLLSVATLWAFAALGQQRTVTGVVTSAEDGSPLPQLSVMLKGSTPTGVVTDLDGRYRIQVPGPEAVLQFVYMGMATQEITVGDRSEINVVMQPVDVAIEQAVITGYGKTARAAFTGSASTLSDKQFKDRVAANPIKALEGTVPGLQMTTGTGQPGAPATIFIRGRNSLNSGTQPLYVIDGVPFEAGAQGMRSSITITPLANLNPDDIESYTVLKDATATSIYGARAANGVIVITTKQGKEGSFNVNFTARVGAEMMPAYSDGYHLVGTAQWKELTDEAIANSYANPRSFLWRSRFLKAGTTLEEATNAVYTRRLRLDADPSKWPDVDWLKEVTRTGLVQEYSLNLSGGAAGAHSIRHFVSLNFLRNEAMVVGKDLTRYSFRYNMNQRPVDYVAYGFNLSVSQSDINLGSRGGTFADPITQSLMIAPVRPVRNKQGEWNWSTGTGYNPVAIRSKYGDKNQIITRRILLTPYIDIMPIEGLTLTSRLGLDVLLGDEFEYWSFLNPQGRDMNGLGENQNRTNQLFTWTNTANYTLNFWEKNSLTVLFGHEAQLNTSKQAFLEASNYPTDKLVDIELASVKSDASTRRSELRLQSILSNAQYSYDEKYFLSGSLRFDGSSRFHTSHYWAPFWSVGIRYNLTREAFMEPVSRYVNLMIRSSYGTSGNQVVGGGWYAYRDLYGYGYNYDNRGGSLHYQFGANDLTWERTNKFNVGLDIGILQRVNVSVDYYYHLTDDMVFDVPISATTGQTSTNRNLGALSNQGVEFTIRADAVKTEDLQWTITLVGAHNRNRVERLSNEKPIEGSVTIIEKGRDIYTFKMKEWGGVDPQTGMARWVDSAGNWTSNYNLAAKKIMGSASPKFQGSITSELAWRGFDFSFTLFTSLGGKVFGDNLRYNEQIGGRFGFAWSKWVYNNRWKKPGDDARVPRVAVGDQGAANYASSRFLMNGNYLKIKTVTLGYTLPKQWLTWGGKTYVKGIRVYVTGENLYTTHSSKYRGFDPAGIGANGIQFFNYPMPLTVVGGINVNF